MGTAFGALLGPVAGPAAADEERGAVTLDGPQHTRFLAERHSVEEKWTPDRAFGFTVGIRRAASAGHGRVRVRIDIGRLAGVAAVSHLSKACHREKTRVDCVYEVGEPGSAGGATKSVEPFDLRAAKGSENGDRGRVTIVADVGKSGPASGSTVARRTTDVVVGVPRLTVRKQDIRQGDGEQRPKPGGTMPFRLAVRNEGKVRAENGFGISVESGDGVRMSRTRTYRNCGYQDLYPSSVQCEFERELRPQETVSLDRPLLFRIPKRVIYSNFSYSAFAIGGPDDPDLNPGSSQKKHLERHGNWRAGHDTDPALGVRETDVTGRFQENPDDMVAVDTHLDLAAVGAAAVHGAEGETVDVGIGVRKRWPDGTEADVTNHVEYGLRFTAPEGTTVVGVPMDEGEALCSTNGRQVSCPWGFEDEDIRLRIDRKVPGAAGRLEVVHGDAYSAHDRVRENDSLAIPLRVAGITSALRAQRLASAAFPYAVPAALLLMVTVAHHIIRRRKRT
ncbi:hypothetical protein HW130_03585 [Streptomyces sp. PKU-EA00015]|uniref:hypothetical protein n=1 Tax=Streptomyces sp. PKU-EA00015 TaxID=2748326 RepID=UPI0015A3E118|nr:hypothetical protein [Streptomyces sp. PKU-EA00015]NWF25354.1 hypothetical protein [Streptomyces sp. PKU-EA00015]